MSFVTPDVGGRQGVAANEWHCLNPDIKHAVDVTNMLTGQVLLDGELIGLQLRAIGHEFIGIDPGVKNPIVAAKIVAPLLNSEREI